MVKITQREGVQKSLQDGLQDGLQKGLPARDNAAPAEGITLDRLTPGQAGVVLTVEAEPALRLHLMELGFVGGSPVAFLMSTPFGDPNIYSLRGTSIALRKSEAKCIRVRS